MRPHRYEFQEQLVFSQGQATGATVRDILLREIPGAVDCRPAEQSDDRSGTDWWVDRQSGYSLSVDCKIRRVDYSVVQGRKKADDLALETYSVVESGVPGWTRNESKRTDYILWLWKDTGRWCLVPFPLLCGVFTDLWEAWREQYKDNVFQQQTTRGQQTWRSECVFVPRRVVWAEIYKRYA